MIWIAVITVALALWRWLRPGRIEGEFERMGRVKKGMNKR